MKSLKEIHDNAVLELVPIYGEAESRAIVRQMLEHFCSVSYLDIVLDPTREIDTSAPVTDVSMVMNGAASNFNQAISMLCNSRPMQYVMGGASFGDWEYYVTEGVLIPRPETLELVRMVACDYIDKEPRIADIGTGSGCIALSLKLSIPRSKVDAFDISSHSERVFEINRKRYDLDVNFRKMDVLTEELPSCYDVIVSNPPYVTRSESPLMRANVLDYEPEEALFVEDDDPLVFYRRIGELGCRYLNNQGRLFFEINERFAEDICRMLEQMGYSSVHYYEDIFGKPRFVEALWSRS